MKIAKVCGPCSLLRVVAVVGLAALFAAGCASESPSPQKASAFTVLGSGGQTNLVLAPARSPVGHVVSVNYQSKFVVINFPVGQLPALGTRLSVFHGDKKAGEVVLTKWAKDSFSVADIIAGAARAGDEVRAE